MKIRRLLLLALATHGLNTQANPSSAADFISTPPIPITDVLGKKWVGSGVLQIQYEAGKITQVRLLEKSGNSALDNAAIRHVREKFMVRPTASGSIRLPFRIIGDFVKMPSFSIPASLRTELGTLQVESIAKVTYQNGRITQAILTKSTGNARLDQLIPRHIQENYTVIAGSSGTQDLPIRIDFKSSNPALPRVLKIGRVYEFQVPSTLRSQVKDIKTQVLLDIYYQNHKITRVVVLQSCGNKGIDQAVIEDAKKRTTIAVNGSGKIPSLVPIQL